MFSSYLIHAIKWDGAWNLNQSQQVLLSFTVFSYLNFLESEFFTWSIYFIIFLKMTLNLLEIPTQPEM